MHANAVINVTVYGLEIIMAVDIKLTDLLYVTLCNLLPSFSTPNMEVASVTRYAGSHIPGCDTVPP